MIFALSDSKSDLPLLKNRYVEEQTLIYVCKNNSCLLPSESIEDALKQIENQFTPDFIFYQCGVDILKTDALGKLGVSMEGCKQRDEIVFQFAKRLDVPVVCTMGGGYSKDIKYIIDAHVNTYKLAHYYFG